MSQPRIVTAWRWRLVIVMLAAVLLPAGAALLYAFPPEETPFYPRCMFHTMTGLYCPGCGATRCLAALVHGDLAQALAYNPLLVVALPFIALVLFALAYGLWTGRRVPWPRLPAWTIHVLAWTLVAYAVLRNVDVFPLNLLAPHAL